MLTMTSKALMAANYADFLAARYPDGVPRDRSDEMVLEEFARWMEANRPDELRKAQDLDLDEPIEEAVGQALKELIAAGLIRTSLRVRADGTVERFFFAANAPSAKAPDRN
jgi:hypothetical protein